MYGSSPNPPAKAPRPAARSMLSEPVVSWRAIVLSCVVWGTLLVFGSHAEVGAYLDSRLAQPLDFRFRDAVGENPVISPKLKIYAIDDSTFSRFGTWVLSLQDWVKVFKAVAANHPRAILVDSMFSGEEVPGDLEELTASLRSLGAPIIVGSFATPRPVQYREQLDLTRPDYKLSAMLNGRPFDEAPPLEDRRNWSVYGAATALQPMFTHIGHFLYGSTGTISPLIRVGEDQVLMHMGLYIAKERRFERRHLILDGVTVPVDENAQLPVNFVPPAAFFSHAKSMKGLIELAREGRSSGLVEPGDVVLVIPQMYTGNTDFKMTPFGFVPGGFVIASVINSVLTGEWLKPLSYGESLIAAGVIAGAMLAVRTGVVFYWGGLVLGLLAGVLGSLWLFAYQSVVVPWLLPAVGFVGSSLTVFAVKLRNGERKAALLRQAFDGAVAPSELKAILKHPEHLSFDARERVVTLMFVDVVGFSLLAENMLPRMAFDNLKKMLATIGDTIHAHGGFIDKTLGDGLLCYFGYRFDSDSSSPDHAEQALRCAIKIQEENLRRNIEAAAAGDPVYPLRIGVNTASCYLGDLGSHSRIDFTVVGNGVNFAKRLEGACEMHCALIGATTNDLVKGIGLPGDAFTKRFIRIKHHSELVEAYEYDPFHADPELKALALDGFRKCANIERVDQRWPVHDASKFQLRCDFGDGELVNFSHGGLSIRLAQLLAKGTRLNIVLDAAAGTLKRLFAKDGLEVLQGEVMWGYADSGSFVHGVMLTNVSDEQSDRVVEYLCEFAFSRDVKRGHDKVS